MFGFNSSYCVSYRFSNFTHLRLRCSIFLKLFCLKVYVVPAHKNKKNQFERKRKFCNRIFNFLNLIYKNLLLNHGRDLHSLFLLDRKFTS